MQKFRLSFCLACLLWLGVATVGKGQTYVSIPAGSFTALYSAIVNANQNGSNTVIRLAQGAVYELNTTLPTIDKNCTIVIEGNSATLQFQSSVSSGIFRMFHIYPTTPNTVSLTIRNLHLKGKGNTATTPVSEAIDFSDCVLTLEGCELSDFSSQNASSGAITGISPNGSHKVTIKKCYIHDNRGRGLSCSVFSFDVDIQESTFANHSNTAPNQGTAIYLDDYAANSSIHSINNCTFYNNGIHIDFQYQGKMLEVNQCTFSGGVYAIASTNASVTARNSVFVGYSGTTAPPVLPTPFSGAVTPSNCLDNTSATAFGLATTLSNKGGFAPVLAFSLPSAIHDNADANAINTDQRGAVANGVRDRGAYEFNGTFPSSSFEVSNTNPFGLGSLYAAINNANNQPTPISVPTVSAPVIVFTPLVANTNDINYQSVTNHYRIQPVAISSWSVFIKGIKHLPDIERANTTIDGGGTTNSNTVLGANNASLRIELHGDLAGLLSDGLVISALNCVVQNLNINSFKGNGIKIESSANGSWVRGCFIGTDVTGLVDLGNAGDGVLINNAIGIMIGGTTANFQNIISDNSESGIDLIGGSGNTIVGNVIGMNALKDAPIGNGGTGIQITASNGLPANRTVIGGTSSDLNSNLISGNASNGVYLKNSTNIDIYRNYIGVGASNTSDGIRIEGNSSNINIGNGLASGRNVVGRSSTDNILIFENVGVPSDIVIAGNHIGVGADGTTSLGGSNGVALLGATNNITISQNVIACNALEGISLGSSSNGGIAPPVITQALTTSVSGTANQNATVEVYVDNTTCATSNKQGSVYLGTTTASATGNWTFTTDLSLSQGQHITATQRVGNNTSEFSASQTVNHLPTGTSITVGASAPLVLEDVVSDLNDETSAIFADTDAGDTFWGVKIESLPANGYGNLRYVDASGNTILVVAGNSYRLSASSMVERLVYTSDGNGNITTAPVTFSFRVIDSKQEASATANTATIIVTPVNDLPTSADTTLVVLEDTDFALIEERFTFSDAEDTGISRLQIITLPTKGTLLLNGTAVMANSIIPEADLPLLKYKSALNENGSEYTTFTFKVIDSQDGASLTHTATINVTPVNDAPTVNAITSPQPDISANSNPVKLKLTGIGVGGGADEANTQQILSVTTTSNKPIITPTISATMDTLTYSVSQAVTQDTDVTITVTVRDTGGTANGGIDSKTVTFQVKVVPNLLTPYNLSATVASASSIQLAWEDDNPNVQGLYYEIYRTETSETNTFTKIDTTSAKSYKNGVGLAIGTYYIYKVLSISAVGYSEYSNLGAVELVNVSASPTNLQATAPTGVYDKINLTWTDNSNDEEGFRLERKSVYSGNLFEELDILPANTTTYTDTELLPNVKYTYRIRSYNDNGQSSAYSSEANTRTNTNAQMPTPLPPFDLEATSVSTRQINLSWEYSINPDVIYSVERSTDGTNFTEISEFVTASLSSVKAYIDTVDVLQGTLYHYRVRASTGGGLSGYSNVDTARAICNLQDLAIVRTDNGKEVICEGKSAAMSIVSDIAGATYQWRRNGVIIPNAKFETFYASQTGVYTCTIAVDNCQAISVNSLFVAVLNEPEALTVLEQNGELLASINDADAYQWYFDYRPITGATSRNYKPTNAGVYYVVATVESCVSTSNTYFYAVLANETTNISQYIHLAPNPARLQTEVRFALPTMGDYAMEVLDTKGKTWLRNAGKKTDVELRQTISLAKVPAGVYLIKLRIGNQQGYKKLVVGE